MDIIRFRDLSEQKADQKVKEEMYRLWDEMDEDKLKMVDHFDSVNIKEKLEPYFKEHGEERTLKELENDIMKRNQQKNEVLME